MTLYLKKGLQKTLHCSCDLALLRRRDFIFHLENYILINDQIAFKWVLSKQFLPCLYPVLYHFRCPILVLPTRYRASWGQEWHAVTVTSTFHNVQHRAGHTVAQFLDHECFSSEMLKMFYRYYTFYSNYSPKNSCIVCEDTCIHATHRNIP